MILLYVIVGIIVMAATIHFVQLGIIRIEEKFKVEISLTGALAVVFALEVAATIQIFVWCNIL